MWRWLCDLWVLIRPSRFSLLAVVVYGFFVIVNDQGRAVFLLSTEYPLRYFVVITFFAINVWLWARLMVSYRYLPAERRYLNHDYLRREVEDFEKNQERINADPNRTDDEKASLRQRLSAYDRKARAAIKGDHPRISDERLGALMISIPRLYGVLVFLFSAVSLFVWWTSLSRIEFLLYAVALALAGAVFWLAVKKRRDFSRRVGSVLRGAAEKHGEEQHAAATSPETGARDDQPKKLTGWRSGLVELFSVQSEGELRADWRWYSIGVIPKSAKIWLSIFICILCLFFVFALWDPIVFSAYVTPLGSILLPLSFLTMVGTGLLFWLDDRRFPVATGLIVAAALLSFFLDNHKVRLIADETAGATFTPNDRIGAEEFVKTAVLPPSRPIIVATAGGGIRAAYWTAHVLAELHDKNKNFHDNLLAISTVSGGGLGAAAYLAAVKCVGGGDGRGERSDSTTSGSPESENRVADLVHEFLSQDFLSAPMAAYLTRDFAFGLLPDRAQALERAWELAWRKVCPWQDPNVFSEGMLGLWNGRTEVRPALLINATLVQSGKRIVTAPFRIEPSVFREALDLYAFVGERDLPLSTAVHNGARFTYLSPAGTLVHPDPKIGTTGQVIDGGYFENYGAETAADLLTLVCGPFGGEATNGHAEKGALFGQSGNNRCPNQVKPIVIQISSDPELVDDAELSSEGNKPKHARRVNQISAPLTGFQHTRPARGVSAMKRLYQLTEGAYKGTFVHFRLCELKGRERPPLGWFLSEYGRETIQMHLQTACEGRFGRHNSNQMRRVLEALNGSP